MKSLIEAGRAIQGLRRSRGLNGNVLAKQAGMSQAKLSKIETGALKSLKQSDLEQILNILQAPQALRTQISMLFSSTDKGRLHPYPSSYEFSTSLEMEKQCTTLRVFSFIIPALLQTAEWHLALPHLTLLEPAEINRSMEILMRRQDLVWDKSRRYIFLIPEAGLYTAPAGPAEQIKQLDRIERLGGLTNVTVGIIPVRSGLAPADLSSFCIYDEQHLRNCLPGRDIITSDSQAISAQLRVLAALERLADYGDAALAHIRRAQDHFR